MATMNALQASPLALNDAELAMLAKNGFVISDRRRFNGFVEGWLAIYKADLPLYISADALLHGVHRSYDAILKATEDQVLVGKLQELLVAMRKNLAGPAAGPLSAQTRGDADFFTGVALSLLNGSAEAPVAGAKPAVMAMWVEKAKAAGPLESLPLFGSDRDFDFSQFKPRGHYAPPPQGSIEAAIARNDPDRLARYFRSVMWLGRAEARIADVDPNGALEIRRRELELALGLRALLGPQDMAAWQELETAMNTFVGERDAMGPGDVDRFYSDLGIAGFSQLASVPDSQIAAVLERGAYGVQRIASDLLWSAGGGTLPRSFSFTGQRYIVDSEVFSNVVANRVQPPPGKPSRMMPNPLDVGYAVFKNEEARRLLATEIETYGYGPNLQAARRHVDSLDAAFWESGLYSLWTSAIQTLSSGTGTAPPPFATTEAWDRRVLSTQLASWAELRHDTILYAKQSYTSGVLCSYPDAYVDPYPAFYRRLAEYGARGKKLLGAIDFGGATGLRVSAERVFGRIADVAVRLQHIAEEQQNGQRPTAEELDFINHAAVEDPPRGGGCGGSPRVVHGWYVDFFFDGNVLAFKPTIADVHTQATTADGTTVGRVLHVATGAPRLMVVNVDGVRSFVGLVSDYAQVITDGFKRLSDEEWEAAISRNNPEDVSWMKELVVR
jgi:hypothetical protein